MKSLKHLAQSQEQVRAPYMQLIVIIYVHEVIVVAVML